MRVVRLEEAAGPADLTVFATQLLEGTQSNVRIIRLGPAQALPPHRHEASDLMLFAASGEGELDTDRGTIAFPSGSLAFYTGSEELRVRNVGQAQLVLLAFLAPRFPPASS
jgi:quercetin dioxygenase-like cupin family protein